MIKFCKYLYLHLSIINFYNFVIVTLQTHFLPFIFTKNYEKARMELKKNREKNDAKNRNGQILSTF